MGTGAGRRRPRGGHGSGQCGCPIRASSATQSAGSGACSAMRSPLAGWSNASARACRNIRSNRIPARASPRANCRLSTKSPYFGSPTIGCPACARWTRIWWVRPVLIVTSSSVNPANACATLTSVSAARAGAPLRLQAGQRAAPFGEQQDARGLLVQPVHEFEEARARPRAAQLLDDAERHPRPAVHRDAGGLVDREQVIVLVHERELARRHRRRLVAQRQPQRRQPHLVTRREPGVGAGAAAIDPHLASADHAVDMALGHPLELAPQEVVQPLAGGALVDDEPVRCRTGLGAGAWTRRARLATAIRAYNAWAHMYAVTA